MWISSADWIDVRRLVLKLKPVIIASESLPFDSTATTTLEQHKSTHTKSMLKITASLKKFPIFTIISTSTLDKVNSL